MLGSVCLEVRSGQRGRNQSFSDWGLLATCDRQISR